MCGITGLIGLNGKKITEISEVRKMMNAIIHRGPDDSGMAAFRVERRVFWMMRYSPVTFGTELWDSED